MSDEAASSPPAPRVCVLRPGEAMLLPRDVRALEVVLYRALPTHDATPPASNEKDDDADNNKATTAATSCAHERPPLFFDTTAMLFHAAHDAVDYVATGRSATTRRSLLYKPHAVVLGTETAAYGYCTYNLAHSRTDAHVNDDAATTMAAGDGVLVDFARMDVCVGVLVCATLFSRHDGDTHDAAATTAAAAATASASLSARLHAMAYYMVRTPGASVPLCLVPLAPHSSSSGHHGRTEDAPAASTIALMLRRLSIAAVEAWELVSVGESLACRDVGGVVSALHARGLRDPAAYCPLARPDDDGDGDKTNKDADASAQRRRSSGGDDDDGDDDTGDRVGADVTALATVAALSRESAVHFDRLLRDVPPVIRDGRRRYNVGRPAAAAVAGARQHTSKHNHHNHTDSSSSSSHDDDDDDDDDEDKDATMAAMRAVAPRYRDATPVRYAAGVYNVGSRPAAVTAHYVRYREAYGLAAAAAQQQQQQQSGGRGSGAESATGAGGLATCADGTTAAAAVVVDAHLWPLLWWSSSHTATAGAFAHTREALARCRLDTAAPPRPPPPADLLPSHDAAARQRRGSSSSSTHSHHHNADGVDVNGGAASAQSRRRRSSSRRRRGRRGGRGGRGRSKARSRSRSRSRRRRGGRSRSRSRSRSRARRRSRASSRAGGGGNGGDKGGGDDSKQRGRSASTTQQPAA